MFEVEEDPAWSMNGEPWSSTRFRDVLSHKNLELARSGALPGVVDVDAAVDLARLAHCELEAFGTDGSQRLDDDGVAAVLRTLRMVLRRLGVAFDPPFRDFRGFHGFWSAEGMSGGGGWGARRGYLNGLFAPVFSRLDEIGDERVAPAGLRGVDGQARNLIFASTGPKPEIVLRDAVDNTIEVTRNAEHCLFYNRPIGTAGLTWGELRRWWQETNGLADLSEHELAVDLYHRLQNSMSSNPIEQLVFRTYCQTSEPSRDRDIPALLPQVYLHFDPLTWKQRGGRLGVLARERMDFLLLGPDGARIVIEVDGVQHYADTNGASPRLYSAMVAEDRRLRLLGYEVYRFGGHELSKPDAEQILRSFFTDLLARITS